MYESRIGLGGGMIFWTPPEYVNIETFRNAFEYYGHKDLVPESRPLAAALEDALKATMGGPRTLIRRLKKRDGFVVINEDRGDDENNYDTAMSVRLDEDCDPPVLRFRPYNERSSDIVASFNQYRNLFRGTQVTSSLVALLARMRGVSLRPHGALYWLPSDRLPEWRSITQAIEGTAAKGTFKAYLIEHEINHESLQAIRDGLIAEVKVASETMYAEIMDVDNPLGGRALKNRKEECEALIQKIALYEGLLDTGLAELRSMVEVTKEAAAAAVMLEAAGVNA